MRSNLLALFGVLLILLCVVLLGGWKVAIGLAGVVLLAAAWSAHQGGDVTDGASE